jgi:hypothetical protein
MQFPLGTRGLAPADQQSAIKRRVIQRNPLNGISGGGVDSLETLDPVEP